MIGLFSNQLETQNTLDSISLSKSGEMISDLLISYTLNPPNEKYAYWQVSNEAKTMHLTLKLEAGLITNIELFQNINLVIHYDSKYTKLTNEIIGIPLLYLFPIHEQIASKIYGNFISTCKELSIFSFKDAFVINWEGNAEKLVYLSDKIAFEFSVDNELTGIILFGKHKLLSNV